MSELEVHKEIVVARSAEDAFRLFTEGISEWWPLASHSLHGASGRAVFEPRLGGRIYELAGDSSEAEWGRVLAWDPPGSFTISWQPNPDSAAATEITVRFEPSESGRTRIELSHVGWERLGDAAQSQRDNYDAGWDGVLGDYAALPAG